MPLIKVVVAGRKTREIPRRRWVGERKTSMGRAKMVHTYTDWLALEGKRVARGRMA